MEAGTECDVAVSDCLRMAVNGEPSRDWNHCMYAVEVFMRNATFSQRKRFWEAVQNQCVLESGARVAWPDAMGWVIERLGPVALCRAILSAKRSGG